MLVGVNSDAHRSDETKYFSALPFNAYTCAHSTRKYSRLHVRYSRLQQGPVRFTFTAQGEMVEEEEVADNLSDEDPTYGDDHKMETVKPLPGGMVSYSVGQASSPQ